MSNFEIEAMKAGLNSADRLIKDSESARQILEAALPEHKGDSLFNLSARALGGAVRLAVHLRAALDVIATRDEAGDGERVVELASRTLNELGL